MYGPQPEANFALYFRYGSCLGETLDTFEGTFSRGMCPPDPPVTVLFVLSAGEMRTIYQEMAQIDFFGYPDQFSVVVPEGAVYMQVTPSDSYHLRVRNGEVEKELYWTDDILDPTTPEADRLRAFLKKVIGIIHGRPELEQVPEPSGCGCAQLLRMRPWLAGATVQSPDSVVHPSALLEGWSTAPRGGSMRSRSPWTVSL